ncbi:hypothetical protein Pmani_029072 [Petrolisthes manimaculis]|uniref:Uncharacterized protein n=1 Tax=Petrolisthes manimaculis TaxID=1843537 RepID=A0AAE1P043_9EUCA|nr:hypothetical protein Pmani_029072 [Petrolisthes manimaculis]
MSAGYSRLTLGDPTSINTKCLVVQGVMGLIGKSRREGNGEEKREERGKRGWVGEGERKEGKGIGRDGGEDEKGGWKGRKVKERWMDRRVGRGGVDGRKGRKRWGGGEALSHSLILRHTARPSPHLTSPHLTSSHLTSPHLTAPSSQH